MVTQTVTWILSSLIVLSQVALLVVLILMFTPYRQKVMRWFGRQSLFLALIVSLTATLGSLFYSQIAGYTPCVLCWWQRIFMYPQVLLFGVAIWYDDIKVYRYSLALSIVGGAIAAYHYVGQVLSNLRAATADPLLPCGADGVSCATTYTMSYGYITIPMMALTGFVLISVLMLFLWKAQKD